MAGYDSCNKWTLSFGRGDEAEVTWSGRLFHTMGVDQL